MTVRWIARPILREAIMFNKIWQGVNSFIGGVFGIPEFRIVLNDDENIDTITRLGGIIERDENLLFVQ